MQEPRLDEPERAVSSVPAMPAGSDPPPRFEEVYVLYAARLRKIAIRNFGIPISEAETLVHDVFATYITQATSVRAVERYLVGAICNASRHFLRRSDAADALFCGETPCAATASDALLDEVARKLLLGRVLRRIDCRCRDLLQRYYLNGETTDAIAKELDSTPGSILVTLHKCRKRARDAYRSITETT
jgi:RNA polymerase sigma factor (sigma-70 family)